jgi:hypothetical protein
MYLRVKRFKTTVFLECSPRDKVEDLRRKLGVVLKVDPAVLRLAVDDSTPLAEQKTVVELGLQNDSLIYVVYRLENGAWEKINIPPPEILEEDEEEEDDGED